MAPPRPLIWPRPSERSAKRSPCGSRLSFRASTADARSGLDQTRGLVVPAGRDRTELLFVLAAVVCAEQEFAAVHLCRDVGLGAAGVAAVQRGQSMFENDTRLIRCG